MSVAIASGPADPSKAFFIDYSRTSPAPTTRLTAVSWVTPRSVNGGPAAEDSRKKLRAHDEAREQRQSSGGRRSPVLNTPSSEQEPNQSRQFAARSSSPLIVTLADALFGRDATFEMGDLPSPQSKLPESALFAKRNRSATSSPEILSKRLRADTSPIALPNRTKQSPSESPTVSMRGGGPVAVAATHSRQSSLTEQTHYARSESGHARVSSTLSFGENPRVLPSTPPRSYSSRKGSPRPMTPPWMQPFQLVEGEKSIFINVHGEYHEERPLCLYCYRLRGAFNPISEGGCEVCGEEKILQGHYWEAPYRE
ncbi:hypothetical protein CC80DRAFT_588206 [Byssothecium circinans]|uniref:Uncharacterized protein n=1 Tax=Byssothecium circinans TaxID=147558 RepID=A0A6A5UED8_9PLEO|nr:hypothetical protein CC80DRAFT_588206 [Byssothecium circinans]